MTNKSIDIQNSDLILTLKNILHEKSLQQGTSDTHIRPVMDITPAGFVTGTTVSNTTGSTFYTASATKETVIYSVSGFFVKDITATCTSMTVTAKVGGQTTTLFKFRTNTLTVERDNCCLVFPKGIKIDKGSSIAAAVDTNVANFKFDVVVNYTEI